jgi:hypothetical protein
VTVKLTLTDEVLFDLDREGGQAAVALDLAKTGLGLAHPGRGPPQTHLPIAPALDVAVDHPDGGDHRLARVGRLQRELELARDPQAGDGQRFLHPLSERGGRARVLMVELEREGDQFLERGLVVGVLQHQAKPGLDRRPVALGEMVKHVSLLVLGTALHRHVVPEHLPYRFPERLRSVNDEQKALLDIDAPVDEIGQERGGDRGVLTRSLPQAERELLALGGDPERDDIGVPVQLDPVEHHHRQAQIG